MNVTRHEAVDEFRAWVLDAYRPLLEDQGFAELPARQDPLANEFTVRLGNATTVIEVEGISYGHAAWTKVLRLSHADRDTYGLPIADLLATRVPECGSKRVRSAGQQADVFRDAADIIQYAQDVLAGDFTAIDAIASERRRSEQERLASAPSIQQRAANAALSEAGHAFKRGDYAVVVQLLEPHLELLTPSQRERYEAARERVADA